MPVCCRANRPSIVARMLSLIHIYSLQTAGHGVSLPGVGEKLSLSLLSGGVQGLQDVYKRQPAGCPST